MSAYSGEFPHLRDEDLPQSTVEVALGYVRGILYSPGDLQGDDAKQRTANNIARAVLQAAGWEPRSYQEPEEDARNFTRCFVCGERMPPLISGYLCWGVPGRGVAHQHCFQIEIEDDAA